MTCTICKTGQLVSGKVTVTLSRGVTTVVIKDVPGRVCDDCGEYWLDESVTETVSRMADEAARRGQELQLLKFGAA
jgi:YgiT-type zinc finger domain-containing protein